MSKIELPPSPEPDVMCDCGGDYFTAVKLRARDRQIVELCASIVESVNNYDNPMTANDCAAAIRALLDEKGNE